MWARDVRAVARIEQAVFHGDAWPVSAFAYLVGVFRAARPPRGRLWAAELSGGRVVGYVGVELSVLGGEADVINLAVDPAQRRRGVGRQLLAAAIDYCRARRVPLIWLRVRAANRAAQTFYRRCGFRRSGRFRDYYDDPREDAILMRFSARPTGGVGTRAGTRAPRRRKGPGRALRSPRPRPRPAAP